jgi:hypothetical protein
MASNVHSTAATAGWSNPFFWSDHCFVGILSFSLASLSLFEPVKSLF